MMQSAIPYDLRALEIFVAVADDGGMAAAARRFGLTQPSVSQRISELEKGLGVALFDRTVRPIALTSAGMVLRQQAAMLISEASSIIPLLRQASKARLPVLRIGIVESLTRILSGGLYSFLCTRSDRASILAGSTSSQAADFLVRKLDIILGASSLEEVDRMERAERWPIIEEPYILALPLGVAKPASLADLKALSSRIPLLRFSSRTTTGSEIRTYLSRLRIDAPQKVEFDSSESLAKALCQGDGWAIVTPLCAYQGGLTSDHISFQPLPTLKFGRQITLICRTRELGQIPAQLATVAKNSISSSLLPFVKHNMPDITFKIL